MQARRRESWPISLDQCVTEPDVQRGLLVKLNDKANLTAGKGHSAEVIAEKRKGLVVNSGC